MSLHDIYNETDALGLAALVHKGEVQPGELVEEAIRRIETVNPQLNAVVHKMYDEATTAAAAKPAGPFAGVPFLIKELLAEVKNTPLRNGSRFYNGNVSQQDSEIVRRYRQAGLILIGRTNTPEYGITPYTESVLYGPARNPWDVSRTPGGSSGGSGAAVAARMVPAAHGGDGGGSIRIPAACCGVFGLKPSRNRIPASTDYLAWQGWVNEHALTRSVRDSAALLDATAGPARGDVDYPAPPDGTFLDAVGRDPGKLRIAFTPVSVLGKNISAASLAGLAETVKLLESLGHDLIEAKPAIDAGRFSQAFLTMLCAEVEADVAEAEAQFGRKASIDSFEPSTWALGLLGRKITAGTLNRAIRDLQRIGGQMRQFVADYDLFLTPTLAEPAVKLGALQPTGSDATAMSILGRLNASGLLYRLGALDTAAENVFEFMPVTPLFNVSGQPAMSVPLCWSAEGLPVGMH
ncbi:MAG: amidase, partial [Anaerolineales bacterium]|nr:amidase [Anaerolineales bacterium]